jgi:ABC-type dipeptide/oligopeptide/nickel transport system permease component
VVTYIIRRLLYSVLVLIAASFLVFTFVAKGAGDPLGPLRITPNIDQAGLERIAEEKHRKANPPPTEKEKPPADAPKKEKLPPPRDKD